MNGMRLRSLRPKPGFAYDSLTNAITGIGTGSDARTRNRYIPTQLGQHEIAAAYRGSGLMRKIIRIPALDMVREWRDLKADADVISDVEAEEKRLSIQAKVLQSEINRGLGGGALILGLPGDPGEPAPDRISKGQLAFVNIATRWQLNFDRLIDDSLDPRFGEPEYFTMATGSGSKRIHASRVICFRGEAVPEINGVDEVTRFWGESRIDAVLDAVQDCDTARAAFAALIAKARHLRIGIPGLMNLVATQEGEQQVNKRLSLIALAESLHNVTLYEAGKEGEGERIDDATYNFAGMKEVMNAYGEWASAISDIPITRLLGRAPEGMNSSGESQQEDWKKVIRAKQNLELAPCLDRLDHYLWQSATGSVTDGVWYDFAPLSVPTEDEDAARFKVVAEALERVAALDAMPQQAFNQAAQNTLIEGGFMPGLDIILDDMPDDERFGLSIGGDGDDDPSALVATDAAPRTLYVSRKLLNADEVIEWAMSLGITATLPASDMHVTIAFSRQPVDWMAVEAQDWNQEADGGLVVPPGGARLVERLGDNGQALVLMFGSSRLSWRHEQIKQAGASWDWPEYQPHITLSYEAGDIDARSVEPFRGELRFGPEVFAEVDDGWQARQEES